LKPFVVVLGALVTFMITPVKSFAQTAPTLTLSQVLDEADLHNAEILAARQAIEIDRARLQQVARPPLQAVGGPSIGVDVPGGLGQLQTLNAGVAQQFPAAGALFASRQVAQAGIAITTAQYAFTQRDVERRVINAYYTLASAQAQRLAAEQNVATTQDLLRSADLRRRAGAVGSFEVVRASVELRRTQTDLLRAQAAQRTGSIVLNTLMGRPGSAEVAVRLTPATVSQQNEVTYFARAIEIDPAVAQLRAGVEQASARGRLARTARAPAFSLNAGFQVQRVAMTGQTSRGPTFGASVSLPIVDYGTIQGAVREAQATQLYAEAQLDSRTIQIRSDVSQAVAEVQSSRARLSFTSASLGQARRSLRISQFGYRQGALGALDVLSARNALANARADADQSSADYAAAVARLQLLLGAPITQ